MRERDRGLLDDILEHGREALERLDGVSLAAYKADRTLRLVTERLVEIIGEASIVLSDQAKAAIKIDWVGLRGLRNILAHQYGAVDPARLYSLVKDRLPDLLVAIETVLDEDPDR